MQAAQRAPSSLNLVALAGFCLLALFAIISPVDHDEGQYIAATRLVAEGWRPFLDFPYLQTPLQPYVLAPLHWLLPGYLLISSRLADALLVAAAAWMAGKTAIRLSGQTEVGWIAALLLVLCDSVQFGGSVARNDALPLFLFAFGMERFFGTVSPSRERLLVAGLAFGLAASAKISYALPAAATGLVVLLQTRAWGLPKVASCLAGLGLGGLPTLAFLAVDPNRAWFYMVEYSVDAVRAFQTLNGSTHQLEWSERLERFVRFAVRGPLFLLLVLAVRDAVRCRRRPAMILVANFALALLASLLPMPMFRQYLMPCVIPSILLLAASGTLGRLHAWPRPALAVALMTLAVAGTARSAKEAYRARPDQRPIAVIENGHAIGQLVRAHGGDTLSTLDAVGATDSGLELDRRFAPGPFLFRAGNLAACDDRSLCPVTFDDLTALDQSPPEAIVTGTERKDIGPLDSGLDGTLDLWAKRNGYRARRVGPSTVWIRG